MFTSPNASDPVHTAFGMVPAYPSRVDDSGHISGDGLLLHALAGCRRDLDRGDQLVPPDGVGEVRHGVRAVVDVGGERRVRAPDVEGGRSLKAGELGPPVRQSLRNVELGDRKSTRL